jgi:hypothetical protein
MGTGRKEAVKAYQGKTYSLYGNSIASDGYYRTVRNLTDLFLKHCPDEESLLYQIQMAGSGRRWKIRPGERHTDRSLLKFVKQTLRETLAAYTSGVDGHLRTLPFRKRFDPVLSAKEYQYHLFMIEIELVNRIYRDAFKSSNYRFALIAHCLRDFRPDCRSASGEMEAICTHCTEQCFINVGSMLLKKYDIHPYISVTTDLETLFHKIISEHPSVGALGIACVPELVHGMRLCVKLGIPPVGIPLDANRCARWMNEAHESSFSLRELNDLLK